MPVDVNKIRQDFPVLTRKIHGRPLIYLDNAATSLKPRQVIEAMDAYYLMGAANIHRAVHTLGEEATEKYENTREVVRKHLNAKSLTEIIFTKGTTEGINLLAQGLAQNFLKKGD